MLAQRPLLFLPKFFRVQAATSPYRKAKLVEVLGGESGSISPLPEILQSSIKRAFQLPRRHALASKDVVLWTRQRFVVIGLELAPRGKLNVFHALHRQRKQRSDSLCH